MGGTRIFHNVREEGRDLGHPPAISFLEFYTLSGHLPYVKAYLPEVKYAF
jgi:hypothetical protein